MRYLTSDLEKETQFFHGFSDFKTLKEARAFWAHPEWEALGPARTFRFDERVQQDLRHHKKEMLRLLPETLKSRLFHDSGRIRRNFLTDETYGLIRDYSMDAMRRWSDAGNLVWSEMSLLEPHLPPQMRALVRFRFHDEPILAVGFRGKGEWVLKLAERPWGNPILAFQGVSRQVSDIPELPTYWNVHELFRNNDGTFELNVLCWHGSFSVTFTQMEVEVSLTPYLHRIIEEMALQEAVLKRSVARSEITQESAVRILRHIGGEDAFVREIARCAYEKRMFLGEEALMDIEREVVLLEGLIGDLLYDHVGADGRTTKAGIERWGDLPEEAREELLGLIARTGPRYYHRILTEYDAALRRWGDQPDEDLRASFHRRFVRRYGRWGQRSQEIFSALAGYVLSQKEVF